LISRARQPDGAVELYWYPRGDPVGYVLNIVFEILEFDGNGVCQKAVVATLRNRRLPSKNNIVESAAVTIQRMGCLDWHSVSVEWFVKDYLDKYGLDSGTFLQFASEMGWKIPDGNTVSE
jgi:hypothetical protein